MSYSFSTRQGKALTIDIPVSVDTTGYTLTVEFANLTKTPTASGRVVTLALTAAEVDSVGDDRYRVKAVKAGRTSYVQSGKVEYQETKPGSVLGDDGKIKAELLPASTGGGMIYVSNDGKDSNDGASWNTAKKTVKAAVQSLPLTASGSESFRAGTVNIGPGEFVEQGDIEANREIRFIGSNAKSDNVGTRIRLANGANKHVFTYTLEFASADGYAHGLVFENLTISANASGQGTSTIAAGGITSSATSLNLATVGSLPSGTFDVLVDDEIIGVTAGAGSTSLTVVRGKYGSVAATHAAGATVRFAGSAIVMRGGGFNSQLVNVHVRDSGGPAVRLDHSAVDLHCFNFNASASGGPAFAYIPSSTSSGSMISFLGGQIDDCGSDALYFEGQSGAGVVNISAMKFESRVSTTKHKHCIASRPHSSNGSGMVFNVDGVIAYALGGNREALAYNYNGTSQGAAWNLKNVVGRDGYVRAFKSDRYPVQSPSHTVAVLYAGNFDTGAELAQMQLGSSLIVNSPWNANPNGVVTAPRGSMYLYTGGSSGTALWIKETGTDNQGWVAK